MVGSSGGRKEGNYTMVGNSVGRKVIRRWLVVQG